MNKFFPSYQLYIEAQNGEIVTLPEEYATDREFACKFVITKTTTSTPQNATINIYNLSDTNRKRLFFNWFDQVAVNKRIELYAGYGDEKHLVFSGVQQDVSSYREGASLVTEIHATSMGFAQNGYSANNQASDYTPIKNKKGNIVGYSSKKITNDDYTKINPLLEYTEFEFPVGTPKNSVIFDLIHQFEELQKMNGIEPQVEVAFEGFDENEVYNKPISLVGNLFDLLKEYVPPNTNIWMDGDKLYIVSTHLALSEVPSPEEGEYEEDQYQTPISDEYLEKPEENKFKPQMMKSSNDVNNNSSDILVINADTGLLNTPRFYGQSMSLTTLFEPRVKCGMVVKIESKVQPEFNRNYKVCGITHSCEMGFGTSGSNITTLTLVYPNSNYADVGYTL